MSAARKTDRGTDALYIYIYIKDVFGFQWLSLWEKNKQNRVQNLDKAVCILKKRYHWERNDSSYGNIVGQNGFFIIVLRAVQREGKLISNLL